jgi:hypothetical protein
VTPLEAARRIQGINGKPADHVFAPCFHPTTQEGGEGCHRFMSCHEYWPERCEFLNYEHCTEGDPMRLMPQIVAALEAAEGAYHGWRQGNDIWGPMQALIVALKGEPE